MEYKYLGVYFDELLEFNKYTEVLAGSGQRALGALIGKYKMYPEMGFETYTKCIWVLIIGPRSWDTVKVKKIRL